MNYDLLVMSHLRWDFVFQRPQHLLTRFDRGRVFFVEEPVFGEETRLDVSKRNDRVHVVVPHLPHGLEHDQVIEMQKSMLQQLLREQNVEKYARWYYTAAAVEFSRELNPLFTVYDCMDELTMFKGASAKLKTLEQELFQMASIVFTGGVSLYEAKRTQHSNVHPFPSSVDVKHFAQAREDRKDPADQASIPHPRVGFYGVVDERFDVELMGEVAKMRPDLQFVVIGPVVKIDPEELPRSANIHYLGGKKYEELPLYLSGWDVAMMPFARNDSTKFISPTKTPEYLAGGAPVVSTSITDVINPYKGLGLVHIADTPHEFSRAIDDCLKEDRETRLLKADKFLAQNSWDTTWAKMQQLMDECVNPTTLQAAS